MWVVTFSSKSPEVRLDVEILMQLPLIESFHPCLASLHLFVTVSDEEIWHGGVYNSFILTISFHNPNAVYVMQAYPKKHFPVQVLVVTIKNQIEFKLDCSELVPICLQYAFGSV